MIGRIGLRQSREFIGVRLPIELTGVDNHTARACGMTVHIFGCGMYDNICAPLDRTTVDRCWEGIVHNQGDTMRMSLLGKALDIQNLQRRIGNGFAVDANRVGTKCRFKFFFTAIGIDKGGFNPHFLECR